MQHLQRGPNIARYFTHPLNNTFQASFYVPDIAQSALLTLSYLVLTTSLKYHYSHFTIEKLTNLSRAIQIVHGRTKIQTQVFKYISRCNIATRFCELLQQPEM